MRSTDYLTQDVVFVLTHDIKHACARGILDKGALI